MLKGIKEMMQKILFSLLSERVLKFCFFTVARMIVKSTKTNQDDKFLKAIEEEYNK